MHKQQTQYLGTFVFNEGFMIDKTALKENETELYSVSTNNIKELPIQEFPLNILLQAFQIVEYEQCFNSEFSAHFLKTL